MYSRIYQVIKDVGHVHHICRRKHIVIRITIASSFLYVVKKVHQNSIGDSIQIFSLTKLVFCYRISNVYIVYEELRSNLVNESFIASFFSFFRLKDFAGSKSGKNSSFFMSWLLFGFSFQPCRRRFLPFQPGLNICRNIL